jgi:hypothetical protein
VHSPATKRRHLLVGGSGVVRKLINFDVVVVEHCSSALTDAQIGVMGGNEHAPIN